MPLFLAFTILTLTACANQQQTVSDWMGVMSNTEFDYGKVRTKTKNTEDVK